MIDDPTLTITFADLSGAAENRWIRLEQVGRDDSPAISFAEAAALIDDLYDTSPCDNGGGTGTGGEASGEPVDEETFLNRAVDRLRIKPCKESDGFVDFEVDIMRSHQDEGWNLVGERVEIGESVIMTGRKTEVLELEGAVSHDLAYPYYGDLRVSGATVRDVRGSTVNFARPVTGRVRVAYTAVWERVTVRVPSTADKDGIQRAEDAAVICFWSRLAATLDLRQPEDDTDRDTLRHICPRYRIKNEGDCYELVEHYSVCNCTGLETWDGTERVAVPCPDGSDPGDVVGERSEYGGHVPCEGVTDRYSDPAFYREHCCGDPKGPLPSCVVEREENRGDAEIEGGAEKYRELYGNDVRLTAVTPEGGCGEIIRTWHVRESAAGTDPPRLYVDGTGGTRVALTPGGLHALRIEGGTPPFRWVSIPRGMEKAEDIHFFMQNIHYAQLRSDKATFWGGVLRVADACGREGSITLTRSRNCRLEGRELKLSEYDPFDPPGQPYYPISENTFHNVYWNTAVRKSWSGEWTSIGNYFTYIYLFNFSNDSSVTRLWRSADGNYLACIERIAEHYDTTNRNWGGYHSNIGCRHYCFNGEMVKGRRTLINGETMNKLISYKNRKFMKDISSSSDEPAPGDAYIVTPLGCSIGGGALMTNTLRYHVYYKRYGKVLVDSDLETTEYCDQEASLLFKLERICED